MHHIVYKTTNLINGKIYVGVHSTENINDGYLGSGLAIKRAVKKYGEYNFKRETLVECHNQAEAYDLERVLVCDTIIKRKDVYNSRPGGKGAPKGMIYAIHKNTKEIVLMSKEEFLNSSDFVTRKHSEASKQKLSEMKKALYGSMSAEERAKMHPVSRTKEQYALSSAKQRGKKKPPRSEESKLASAKSCRETWAKLSEEERKAKARAQTDEIKAKISESSKKPKKKCETPCPHCGLTGTVGNMKRYHFDNCKFKKEV